MPEPLHRWPTASPHRRSLAVVPEQRQGLVEAAHCGWCRFSRDGRCSHPCNAGDRVVDVWNEYSGRTEARNREAPHWCKAVNPRGECGHWEPSWWTRLLRLLRLGRAPAMVDPRVWDE